MIPPVAPPAVVPPAVAGPPVPEPPPTGLSIADRLSLPRIHWGWLLLIAGFAALFWAARGVIGPFIAGFVMAYLLDPLALRLERLGLPRWAAAALVLVVFIAAVLAVGFASAPIIQAQIVQLAQTLPRLVQTTVPLAEHLLRKTPLAASSHTVVANLSNRAVGWLSDSVGTIVAGSLAFVNVVTFIVISPLVAFYLLRDWPRIIRQVESWWPRAQTATIAALMAESDAALSGFIRGQSLVCLILAVFYAAGWSLVGLNYGIVLGLLAGILGFVPFLGVMSAVGLSLLVALGQYGFDWVSLGAVLGVFAVGQVLESSILTPNLIGNRIGLHPVWVLFAVFAGGEVAGLAGVFLAVPVAAVLGVIVRSALAHYRASGFYNAERG